MVVDVVLLVAVVVNIIALWFYYRNSIGIFKEFFGIERNDDNDNNKRTV